MFQVGDLIIYGAHGLCRIDDKCEMTYDGSTKDYYVLHPVDDAKLKISVPVDSNVSMSKVMDKERAENILQSFHKPAMPWIAKNTERQHFFNKQVNSGNREDIANVLNVLLRRKCELEEEGKKLGTMENNLLSSIQKTMFAELAVALNRSYEEIEQHVLAAIGQ